MKEFFVLFLVFVSLVSILFVFYDGYSLIFFTRRQWVEREVSYQRANAAAGGGMPLATSCKEEDGDCARSRAQKRFLTSFLVAMTVCLLFYFSN